MNHSNFKKSLREGTYKKRELKDLITEMKNLCQNKDILILSGNPAGVPEDPAILPSQVILSTPRPEQLDSVELFKGTGHYW